MNKQSYPEYLFKHLRRNSKRILSIMLAFAILTENPLSAYASTKATPSNIPESSASIESTDTNIDIDTDFGVEDFETNPDQDPDHGPGIDSTTPIYPYYRPVVDTTTIPDEVEMDNDDIDAILGAGANCIDDFDPDSLVPLTPEQVEAAYNSQPEEQDPNIANLDLDSYDSDIDSHAVGALAAGVGAIMVIMMAIYCSGVRPKEASLWYSVVEQFSQTFKTLTYSYSMNNVSKEAELTQQDYVSLKSKLDNSATDGGYSINLTEKDRLALAYAADAVTRKQYSNECLSLPYIDPANFNIKTIDGYKYYYFIASLAGTQRKPYFEQRVLYSPAPIALVYYNGSQIQFYYRNAATADYGFSKTKIHLADYQLSDTTQLFCYKKGYDYTAYSPPERFRTAASLPCPSVVSFTQEVLDYIPTKNVLLLDHTMGNKVGSFTALMNLSSVTTKSDINSLVASEKNVLQTVTGANTAAGLITDAGTTTKPGTETKPGTGTGTGSGSTTTPDYSGPLTTIIGIITSILTATNGIPNILSLFQLLPTTIKDSIIEALNSIPFFKSALIYLSSISTGVQDILDWDIEAWIDGVNTDLGHAIDNLGADVLKKLANLPNIDNLGGIIGAALAGSVPLTRMADAVVNIADKLKTWNIDNYGEEFIKALETAMAALGLGSLSGILGGLKDLTGAKLDDVLAKLQELAASLAGLKLGTDLDSLSNALKELLTALGLGSLLGAVTNIGSMLGTFSFADLMNLIKALPASIVAAITEALPNWKTPEIEESENDSGFHNFLNLFMIGLLIIILLMILFINCLRFIVLVFNVPASSALIHADMLKGIEYMKNLQIPVFGVSLYALLLSCAYFVIFMTVIAAIRRKIDKMHI